LRFIQGILFLKYYTLNMTGSNMTTFNSLDRVEEVIKMVEHYFAWFNIQDLSLIMGYCLRLSFLYKKTISILYIWSVKQIVERFFYDKESSIKGSSMKTSNVLVRRLSKWPT
jgi:hypothetical protein